MEENNRPMPLEGLARAIREILVEVYWGPIYRHINSNKELVKTFTAFLLKPEQVIFYFGKTHLAIEYIGPERLDGLPDSSYFEIRIRDYTQKEGNFLEQIIGFEYDSTVPFEFPLSSIAEDLILPTNKGHDKLVELKWNFAAQSSIMAMNAGKFKIMEGEFARFVNALFFDADENGLKTRHIKWIDFIPWEFNDSSSEHDSFSLDTNIFRQLAMHDTHYIYPLPNKDDFKYSKLPQINRFIELAGSDETSEPELTSFLSKEENKFILTMAFLSKDIHPQLKGEWQSNEKVSIQPDFFAVHPNGYANIVEFKLPSLKSNSVTGRNNRETFSAEINSYISQTRVYKQYFDDPNNRKWFEEKYGFKVHHPKRILVMGRRFDFNTEEWRDILADYRDIEILTFDDLVDGVMAQFYM